MLIFHFLTSYKFILLISAATWTSVVIMNVMCNLVVRLFHELVLQVGSVSMAMTETVW